MDYDGRMEDRVAKLEEAVAEIKSRLARIETRLDQFATKEDLANMEARMMRTIVSSLFGIFGLMVSFQVLFFAMLRGAH